MATRQDVNKQKKEVERAGANYADKKGLSKLYGRMIKAGAVATAYLLFRGWQNDFDYSFLDNPGILEGISFSIASVFGVVGLTKIIWDKEVKDTKKILTNEQKKLLKIEEDYAFSRGYI